VEAALEHEIARQIEAYESGDPARFPVQETRLFDPGAGVTRSMRLKEGEADYRYFPDPDLPPLSLGPARVERVRAALPELPAARRARYRREFGLSAQDAAVLTSERVLADFFEATARLSGRPRESANWIANDLLAALRDPELPARRVDELLLRPFDLAELVRLVTEGRLGHPAARACLRQMIATGRGALEIVEEQGLAQVEDEALIESWCRQALQDRESVAAEVRAGKEKALGALIGPVMQASKGRANTQKVREILLRLISGS
jgi:aspartyl-tRNA(Asn)/glutamyl-tRNA(Gln) amidotransferase subunit B